MGVLLFILAECWDEVGKSIIVINLNYLTSVMATNTSSMEVIPSAALVLFKPSQFVKYSPGNQPKMFCIIVDMYTVMLCKTFSGTKDHFLPQILPQMPQRLHTSFDEGIYGDDRVGLQIWSRGEGAAKFNYPFTVPWYYEYFCWENAPHHHGIDRENKRGVNCRMDIWASNLWIW